MSVGEDGAVVALKQAIADLSSDVVEDGLLVYVLGEDLVKTEVILLDFYCLFIQDVQEGFLCLLLGCLRFQPDEDANVLLFIEAFALFHGRTALGGFAVIVIEARRQIDFDVERTAVLLLQDKLAIALIHDLLRRRFVLVLRVSHILPFIILARAVDSLHPLIFLVIAE